LNVQGDIQPAWAGTPSTGQINRLFQVVTDGLRISHHKAVLGDRAHQFFDIKLLVTILPQGQAGAAYRGFPFDLTRQDQHADGVNESTVHSGNGIGPAGSGGHVDYR